MSNGLPAPETPPFPSPEPARPPERDTRQSVIEAFNESYKIFSAVKEELTPEDQVALELITDVKEDSLDIGRDYAISEFEDDNGLTYREHVGLPVDRIIVFLTKKIDSGTLSENDKALCQKYRGILFRNSLPFLRGHRQDPEHITRMVEGLDEYTQDLKEVGVEVKIDPLNKETRYRDMLIGMRELRIPREYGVPEEVIKNAAREAGVDPEEVEDELTREEPTLPPAPAEPGIEPELPPAPPAGPPEPEISPAGPEPESVEDIRREVAIVNRTLDPRRRAQEMTELQLRQEMRRGSLWNPRTWFRRIRYRALEQHYREKFRARAVKAMLQNNNTYLTMDVVRNAAVDATHLATEERAAGLAKAEQVEMGATVAGEEIREVQGPLKQSIISEIINPILQGTIATPEQVQAVLRQFVQSHQNDPDVQAIFGLNATQYSQLADYFATDILEMGQIIRQDIEAHKYSLEQIDKHVNVRLANTRWAAETDIQISKADRAVQWLQRHGINPALSSAAISLATFLPTRLAGVGVRAAAAAATPFTGGITGSLFAAFRRNYDLKVDRAAHQVEMAYGMQVPTGARRRERLERFAYSTATIQELLNGGGEYIDARGTRTRRSLNDLISRVRDRSASEEDRRDLISQIAEIEERLDYSVRNKVDLITYEATERVEQGRLELLKRSAEARLELRQVGVSEQQIDLVKEALRVRFEQGIAQQDRAFKIYKLKSSAIAGLGGGIVGLGAGLAVREVAEFALGHFVHGTPTIKPRGETIADLFKKPGNVELTNDLRLHVNPNHTAYLIGADGNRLPNVPRFRIGESGEIIFPGKLPPDVQQAFSGTEFDIKTQTIGAGGAHEILKGRIPDSTTGHDTLIPKGTEWIRDAKHPKRWDLVMKTDRSQVLVDNAHFNKAGRLIGHVNKPSARLHEMLVPDKHAKESRAVEFFKKNGTKIDHREWYSYDRPRSQGNELRLHTLKQGDTIILDMTRMRLGYQTGLNPYTIDAQEVIRSHQSGFAFSLPDHADHIIWIPDGADGKWDGLLYLNPHDTRHLMTLGNGQKITLGEFSKMILNHQAVSKLPDGDIATEVYGRRNVFRLGLNGKDGYIEAGRLVRSDGRTTIQAFATIRGEEAARGARVVPRVDLLQKTITIITERPREIPIPPGRGPEIPIVPLPFWPRFPLEPLIPGAELARPPLEFYYSGENLESLKQWLKQRPSGHRPYKKINKPDGSVTWVDEEGKPVKRDVERERKTIKRYLEEIRESDPESYKLLESLLESPTMHPLAAECRVSVNIPAWMEGKNIYHALEEYVKQVDESGKPLNPDLYEINIIVNRKKGTPSDQTVAEIGRFLADARARGENYHINYVDLELDPPLNTVGNARKIITDLTLLRSLQRTRQSDALYLESEDADLLHVDPKTVINLIKKLDENSHLDAVRGTQDRFPEVLMQNDLLFLSQRTKDFFELMLRRMGRKIDPKARNFTWHRVVTGGWNTGYSAEAYALIGGYDKKKAVGEDLLIGEKISMARGDGELPNTEVIGTVTTRSDSSPRRFISEILTGKTAYSEAFTDQELNEFIKAASVEDLLERIKPFARISPSNTAAFNQTLEWSYQWLKTMATDDQQAQQVYDGVMFWLGFKKGDYEYTPDGKLSVGSWENVRRALEDYRRRHPKPRGKEVEEAEAAVAVPAEPEEEKQAVSLLEKINQALEATGDSATSVGLDSRSVVEYFRNIPLARGAKLENPLIAIEGNIMRIQGSLVASGGRTYFNLSLQTDPSGKLKMIAHALNSQGTHRLRRGQIKDTVKNMDMDHLISLQLDSQIDPTWEVSGFHIVDGKVQVDFKKREGPVAAAEAEAKVELGTSAEAGERTDALYDPEEDSVFSDSEHHSIGVFDGVGGSDDSHIASEITRDKLRESLSTLPYETTTEEAVKAMYQGWQNAVAAIQGEVSKRSVGFSSETTASVVKVFQEAGKKKALILNIGDSRVYARRKDGSLRLLTTDDNVLRAVVRYADSSPDYVEGLIRLNLDIVLSGYWKTLTPEQKKAEINSFFDRLLTDAGLSIDTGATLRDKLAVLNHFFDQAEDVAGFSERLRKVFVKRHIISNIVGADSTRRDEDYILYEIEDGVDFLIATTDGVHDNLTFSQIKALCGDKKIAQEIVDALVEEAVNHAKGHRNIRAKRDDTTAAAIKVT